MGMYSSAYSYCILWHADLQCSVFDPNPSTCVSPFLECNKEAWRYYATSRGVLDLLGRASDPLPCEEVINPTALIAIFILGRAVSAACMSTWVGRVDVLVSLTAPRGPGGLVAAVSQIPGDETFLGYGVSMSSESPVVCMH
jgi:hypothetical protein